MNPEKQQQSETHTTVENTLVQFTDAIKSQEQLTLKMARRNSQVLLYGTFMVILLIISVVFLTWSFKSDMEKMSGYMESMAKDVSVMSNAMTQMQTSTSTMEGGINNIVGHAQSINKAINETDSSVAVMRHIADSVTLMQTDVRGLNDNINNINYGLNAINKQMRKLNGRLGAMGQDVNRMSSPAKMFPF